MLTPRLTAPMLLLAALTLGCGEGGDADSAGEGSFDVPTQAAALQEFLDAGDYQDFPAESGVHPLTNGSPHGNVRVFINDTLDQAMAAGADSLPAGSAAIKELYDEDQTTLIGWAVSVKTQADSDGGEGWYWYEILNGSVIVDGNGELSCTGCHIGSGVDLFATDYPLQ